MGIDWNIMIGNIKKGLDIPVRTKVKDADGIVLRYGAKAYFMNKRSHKNSLYEDSTDHLMFLECTDYVLKKW